MSIIADYRFKKPITFKDLKKAPLVENRIELSTTPAGTVFLTLPDQPRVAAKVFKGQNGFVEFTQYASAGALVWPLFKKLEQLFNTEILLDYIG